jgi:hypothetical protein
MELPSPSRAARAGATLLQLALVFTLAYTAFAVVSLGVGIARDGRSLLWGRNLTVDATVAPSDLGGLPAGLDIRERPDVVVEIHDPTVHQLVLRSLMDLLPLVLFVAGLWLALGIARSVEAGDPFGEGNVERLRRLATLFAAGGVLVAFVNSGLRTALFDELPPHPSLHLGVAGFALPGGALLAALGLFVLSEVFAHGVRLREDVEGTV